MHLWIYTALLLVFFNYPGSHGAKKNSKFVWKRPYYAMPWLKGPNVCAVEEVIGSRKRYYSECMTYMPRRICEKPTFIRYHCCTGFESTGENDKGCSGVVPVVDLMDTAKNLYLREFRKHAKRGNMEGKLREDGAFTVFAPENKAIRESPSRVSDRLSQKDDGNLLLYHMTNDRLYLHQLINNMEIPTLYKGNPPLKVNRYSNGIVTVNCARIILPNQVATNGLLHVTEKVVEPMTEKGTLMEILLKEDHFGELVTALIVTELGNILRDENRMFTLFAPTDEALRKAPPDVVERILNDKDVLEKLLKYHMLETSICSAAVIGPTQQRTLEGQKVNLTCDVNNKLRVNNITASQVDIVGTNGVIHVLDEILIPASVKSLKEVMQELDMFEFLEYMQQAGAADIINGKIQGNYTIFVPSEDAIKALTPQQRRTLQTTGAVRKVVRYHIIPGRVTTRKIIGQQTVSTESDKEDRLQLSVHHRGFSVNGARIISSNHEAGNGVIHVIDKFLMPPEGTAIDKIKEDGQYSTFMSLLQTANLDGLLLDNSGNYTIFAPTNDAFDAMDQDYLENVMSDPDQLARFINYHILGQPVYTSALKTQWQYRFKSLTSDWVTIRKEEAEAGTAGEDGETHLTFINRISKVVGKPIESTNAVIYSIDEVLECPCIKENYISKNDIDI